MAHIAVPPLLRCLGIRSPNAKALLGVYEYQGVCDGRPCYHQTGVSSGNHLWYAENTKEGEIWVITPKEAGVGGALESAVAICASRTRWPWEAEGWKVCGKAHTFVPAPDMHFQVHLSVPQLSIVPRLPALGRDSTEQDEAARGAALKFRGSGGVNGRPAFVEVGGSLRLFWMPHMCRWLLADVKSETSGVRSIVARSKVDCDASWAALFPWEQQIWEVPSAETRGLEDGEALWSVVDGAVDVSFHSPPIRISGDPQTVPRSLVGLYMPQGMAHGRVYYVQRLEDISLESSVGPKCLWFAEDRGQWVLSDPTGLGDSRVVAARAATRAWWPWEAHLGGNTAPAALGAAPFATLPEWHGGGAVLAAGRVGWEVANPSGGKFHAAPDMRVELVCPSSFVLKGHHLATQGFLGTYEKKGLLSSRPFFMQVVKEPEPPTEEMLEISPLIPVANQRYAVWYAEDLEQWVVTEDFRVLDCTVADARVNDTAWFPWEVARHWEVSDNVGGYASDFNLKAELVN